jgi:N,N-dimethylformamidase
MKIVGYSDPLSVRAGETIAFKVSSESPTYDVQIVRLIHGDDNPKGPGYKAEPIEANVNGRHDGQPRELQTGSYVELEDDTPLRLLGSFTLSAWILPTFAKDTPQAVMGAWGLTGSGYCLQVVAGRMRFVCRDRNGREHTVELPESMDERVWHFVGASLDLETGSALVLQHRPGSATEACDEHSAEAPFPKLGPLGEISSPFLIAAHASPDGSAAGCFNGKIETPTVHSTPLDLDALRGLATRARRNDVLACWDFSAFQTTRHIRDRSGNALAGRTVNLPTRAVTGHQWDGSSVNFQERPDLYAAIHFHDDDLDDARWPTDFTWNIPDSVQSGVYAARCTTEDGTDHIPFFVRPAAKAQRASVALLVPTFSYLAYANDHNARDPELRESLEIPDDFTYPAQPEDEYILAKGLTGLYDLHTDGSPRPYGGRISR